MRPEETTQKIEKRRRSRILRDAIEANNALAIIMSRLREKGLNYHKDSIDDHFRFFLHYVDRMAREINEIKENYKLW